MTYANRRSAWIAGAVLVATGIAVAGCQTTESVSAKDCLQATPLPDPVAVAQPVGSVPEKYARFSGIWGNGKWDDRLCHTLVVTSVEADGSAEVIYSHGVYAGWGIREAEYFDEWPAQIEDGTLTLADSSFNANISYAYADGKLEGTFIRNGESTVTLEKVRADAIPSS